MLRQDVLQHAELVRTGELDGEGGILMNVLGAYGSVGELVSQAGCYDWGETEKDRAEAHGQWTLDSKKLISDADRERMRRRPAEGVDVLRIQKANTAAETAAKLAEIEHKLRVFTDGGCDGNGKGGVWGASGWGAHVLRVLPAGDTEVKADLFGPVDTQPDSRWCTGAERASNNTGELEGFGQGAYWVRDKDETEDAVVFLYDSMYAANMVQGLWKPKSSVPMIRRIQAILDDIRMGRSASRRPRKVYFVHVKSHQDDANDTLNDINVLGNIRADTLVQWGKESGPYSRLCDGGEEGDGVNGPSPRWDAERQIIVDRAANDAVDTWQNIVDHDGSATSGRDGGAATDIVSRDATNEEGELADSDLLAATEEAEAAHRADEVRTRSGAGPADSVVDGEERGSGEMVSRARRQERMGFGALSLAGTATYSGGRPVGTAALELAELEELEHQEAALGGTAAEPDTEVNERRADDSVSGDPPTTQNTKSRVGSRGPV